MENDYNRRGISPRWNSVIVKVLSVDNKWKNFAVCTDLNSSGLESYGPFAAEKTMERYRVNDVNEETPLAFLQHCYTIDKKLPFDIVNSLLRSRYINEITKKELELLIPVDISPINGNLTPFDDENKNNNNNTSKSNNKSPSTTGQLLIATSPTTMTWQSHFDGDRNVNIMSLEITEKDIKYIQPNLSENESDGCKNESNECCVCLESKKNVLILPCGHICLCIKCSWELKTKNGVCPICRGKITNLMKVFPV